MAGVGVGRGSGAITPDSSEGIVVSDASGADRVLLGDIGGGDYGLKVTSSDGTTVIIDGTSDIFKIVATGTTSITQAGGTSSGTTIDLSALGAWSTTPAHVSYLAMGNAVSDEQRLGEMVWPPDMSTFGAATSGGAVTKALIGTTFYAYVATRLASVTLFARIILFAQNAQAGSLTVYARYYLLQETAL